MRKQPCVVLCTVPDNQTAETISRKLVEEKLAACCNIIPGLQSIYSWEEKIQNDKELLLVIKTFENLLRELEQHIRHLHPYSVPEVIALPIIHGSVEYLKWMDENVKKS